MNRAEKTTTMAPDEAIDHCRDVADGTICEACGEEHRQLAEWLEELKSLRENNEWISIKDNPPEENGDYLFCGTEAIGNVKYLCRVKYWCSGEIRPFNYAPSVTFTHWVPLPEPPKE